MPPSSLGCTSPLLRLKDDHNFHTNGRIKCVLVGDGAVGKTSLVVSYSTNGFPSEYVPTAFDNYNVLVSVDGEPISVQLCDTAGQDAFDPLRALCYPDTDVFLACFSVASPASLRSVREKWAPELNRARPDAALLLVGTQADRRNDVRLLRQLALLGERPVTEARGREVAKSIGAALYVETSALTQRGLKDAFDHAIVTALARRRRAKKRPSWRKLCCLS